MTSKHDELKLQAKLLLRSKGFSEEEIHEEYQIPVNNKTLRIDAVGINEKHKVAIECGKTDAKRLPILRLFFDEVLLLPFNVKVIALLDSKKLLHKQNEINQLDKTIENLQKDIREREQEISRLEKDRQELRRLKKFANYLAKIVGVTGFPLYPHEEVKFQIFKEFVEEIETLTAPVAEVRQDGQNLSKQMREEYAERIKQLIIKYPDRTLGEMRD